MKNECDADPYSDHDTLVAGKGADALAGGAGFDTYVVGQLSGAADNPDIDTLTSWTTPDGKVTLAQTDGRWKLAIDGGGSLDLGASFTDGDYGIYRLELPTATVPTKKGDLKPDSTQPQLDADGNVIVTTEPAPGRADTLNGKPGDDYIQSLAGNDFPLLRRGVAHESRRWRHGDSTTTPINAGIWRLAA